MLRRPVGGPGGQSGHCDVGGRAGGAGGRGRREALSTASAYRIPGGARPWGAKTAGHDSADQRGTAGGLRLVHEQVRHLPGILQSKDFGQVFGLPGLPGKWPSVQGRVASG